jgi:hypothetical protein
MALVRYLTHPQVRIDPLIPVPDWGLSDIGRARTEVLARSGKLAGTVLIVTSAERKATETAAILEAAIRAPVLVCERMHENDRSATGFLPPDAFEEAANWFFSIVCSAGTTVDIRICLRVSASSWRALRSSSVSIAGSDSKTARDASTSTISSEATLPTTNPSWRA